MLRLRRHTQIRAPAESEASEASLPAANPAPATVARLVFPNSARLAVHNPNAACCRRAFGPF